MHVSGLTHTNLATSSSSRSLQTNPLLPQPSAARTHTPHRQQGPTRHRVYRTREIPQRAYPSLLYMQQVTLGPKQAPVRKHSIMRKSTYASAVWYKPPIAPVTPCTPPIPPILQPCEELDGRKRAAYRYRRRERLRVSKPSHSPCRSHSTTPPDPSSTSVHPGDMETSLTCCASSR